MFVSMIVFDCLYSSSFPRLKHAQQEVKKKQTELKKTEQGYKKNQSAHEAVVKNMDKIEVCVPHTHESHPKCDLAACGVNERSE